MTTLVAGATALAGRLGTSLAHGDPDGCLRLHERDSRLLLDGVTTEPGPDGVRAVLRDHAVSVVLDAGDPFADGVSSELEAAARELGIPHRRVAPRSFADDPAADGWQWVDTLADAARAAWRDARTPVVALVPLVLAADLGPDARAGVAYRQRIAVEPPFPSWLREPGRRVRSTTEAVGLIEAEAATVLLVNDSGDPGVRPFLAASALTGVDVVMVRRPARWRSAVGADAAADEVLAALRWRSTVL